MNALTCRDFERFLVDYLDGALADNQRTVFEGHLVACEACRQYLERYRRAIELGQVSLRSSPDDDLTEVPKELIDAVIDAAGFRPSD